MVLSGVVDHVVGEERWQEEIGTLSVVAQETSHCLFTRDGPVSILNVYLDPERHALPIPPGALGQLLLEFWPLHGALVNRQNRIRSVTLRNHCDCVGLCSRLLQSSS